VLHSSGQLFSHKRKHERRSWDYGRVPYKQPRLTPASTATLLHHSDPSSSVAATIVATTPSAVAVTLLQSSQTEFTSADRRKPVDGSVPRGLSLPASLPSSRPCKSESAAALSKQNVLPSIPDDPGCSSSTAACTDEVAESPKQETAASTSAHSDRVDMPPVSEDPVATATADSDTVPATGSTPADVVLPLTAVDQRLSAALPGGIKLEKKEFMDLEDLVKMTQLGQLEMKTGSGWQQSAACSSVTGPSSIVYADGMSTTSSSTLSMIPSMSLAATKPARPSSERRERDESWQKYLKRLPPFR